MDIPFPETTPWFIDSKWFSADNPCDEEAELTALEQSNQHWLSSVGQQYKARAPLGKTDPEPMEECESEEEEEVTPNMYKTDSVQIVEDSDTAEDAAANIYAEAEMVPIRHGGDSDDSDTASINVPPPAKQRRPADARNVCNCGGRIGRECNYRQKCTGNDESEESEESHDEDEEEELQQSYPPPRSHNEQQARAIDLTDSSEPNMSDQSLWQ